MKAAPTNPPIPGLTKPEGESFFNLHTDTRPRPGAPALLGVPCDTLITELPGAAEGPAALREASKGVGHYKVSENRNLDQERKKAVDLGNIKPHRLDPEQSLTRVCQTVGRILDAKAFPLLIGGDHSLTYGSVKAMAKRFPEVRLLHIDAHYDTTDPAEHGCRINHGTYIRNLIEEKIVPGYQVLQIGMRDFQWSASGREFAARQEVWMLPMRDFQNSGSRPLFEKIKAAEGSPVYISLDIDSVDPAFAPGAGEHMPGGFYSREIISVMEELFAGDFPVIGGDLVEVNPVRDLDGRTCSLAAELLAIMMDGLIKTKTAGK